MRLDFQNPLVRYSPSALTAHPRASTAGVELKRPSRIATLDDSSRVGGDETSQIPHAPRLQKRSVPDVATCYRSLNLS
jgi:hypothetical protein